MEEVFVLVEVTSDRSDPENDAKVSCEDREEDEVEVEVDVDEFEEDTTPDGS